MVKDWRSRWQAGAWPFYYVQIAPYAYHDNLGPAAPLRDAQARAMKLIPNSGMAVSMDVGEEKSIHPSNKTTIAKRLLYWALANSYGYKGLACESPSYKSMQVNNDTVLIRMNNASNGLASYGKPMTAFELAGEDKVFHPAKAWITGDGIRLKSEDVKHPVAVRYAYKDWVVGDVYNTEGLPLMPFRTDDW
jgi:sialate O-acetylesterase